VGPFFLGCISNTWSSLSTPFNLGSRPLPDAAGTLPRSNHVDGLLQSTRVHGVWTILSRGYEHGHRASCHGSEKWTLTSLFLWLSSSVSCQGLIGSLFRICLRRQGQMDIDNKRNALEVRTKNLIQIGFLKKRGRCKMYSGKTWDRGKNRKEKKG
jgi:hypothetical protein